MACDQNSLIVIWKCHSVTRLRFPPKNIEVALKNYDQIFVAVLIFFLGSEDDRSNILQKAKLTATSLIQCNETYSRRSNGLKTIDSTQLCAASNISDSCWVRLIF